MSKPLRLLQIENSDQDADAILRLLMESGFEVFSQRVEDADEFREALQDAGWDVVITDYDSPRFDALGALRILQECGRDIPCVVVSGKLGEDTAVEMMKSGAHDYLTKNNLSRLAPTVEREMAEAAARRESKQAQADLRGSQERLALAVEATQLGTFEFYPRMGKLVWSRFARQHFGVSPTTEIDYETFRRALHPADRENATRKLQASLRYENGGNYADDYRTVGIEDRQERWISSRGKVYFDPESQAVRLVGVILNVTDRKRLEQQLAQSQKLESIGRLAGSIAHDFNNLLTVINGNAAIALEELDPQSPLYDSMKEVAKAGTQAAALTRHLVVFSRRQTSEPRVMAVNEFIGEYESTLRRLVGENIELIVSLDPQGGSFRADPVQMGQVVTNLVLNARDAMPNGGKLTIEALSMVVDEQYAQSHLYVNPGNSVVISVNDTGTGMSAEVKSHLFEPFYTTKDQREGTGLGLPTVYEIVVNQSNGSIWVTSEPGQGTTVKLFFPAEPVVATPAAAPAETVEHVPQTGQTILLVEDEQEVRRYAVGILRKHGYTVLEAANGVEALSVARGHNGTIHLLLTDLIMPEMGGMELREKFHAEFPGVPVLFMSGYTDQIMRHWNDLSSYIQKPFTLPDLLRQVRELVERSGKGSSTAEQDRKSSLN